MKTDFYKVGSEERLDTLKRLGQRHYALIFGLYEENGWTYQWRKQYDHLPSKEELRADITGLINAETERTILTGMTWKGIHLWLSKENQRNISDAVRAATLPVRLKLGEDEDGNPIYHTFEDDGELTELYKALWEHIISSLDYGWREKDAVDYDGMIENATIKT